MDTLFLQDVKKTYKEPLLLLLLAFIVLYCYGALSGITLASFPGINKTPHFVFFLSFLILTILVGSLSLSMLFWVRIADGHRFFTLQYGNEIGLFAFLCSLSLSPLWFLFCFVTGKANLIDSIVGTLGFIGFVWGLLYFLRIIVSLFQKESVQYKSIVNEKTTTKVAGGKSIMASKKEYYAIQELSEESLYNLPEEIQELMQELQVNLKFLTKRVMLRGSKSWDEVEEGCLHTSKALNEFQWIVPKNRPAIQQKVKELIQHTLTKSEELLLEMDQHRMKKIEELHLQTLKSE